jgi:hypothetical protein
LLDRINCQLSVGRRQLPLVASDYASLCACQQLRQLQLCGHNFACFFEAIKELQQLLSWPPGPHKEACCFAAFGWVARLHTAMLRCNLVSLAAVCSDVHSHWQQGLPVHTYESVHCRQQP